jgi:hypothetical protein
MRELSLSMLRRIGNLYLLVDRRVSSVDLPHWEDNRPADMTARNNYRFSVSRTLERLRIEEFR